MKIVAAFSSLLIICLLLGLQPLALADEKSTRHELTLIGGATYWPEIHNLDLSNSIVPQPGRFSVWGSNIEFAYHGTVAHGSSWELLLGGDWGWFGTGNEKSSTVSLPGGGTLERKVEAEGWYLTGSGKLCWGDIRSQRGILGVGAGYYQLTLGETFSAPFHTEAKFNKGAFGGYVSFGIDSPSVRIYKEWTLRLRLEDKIHFASWGTVESLAPQGGALTGPINMLQLGVVWRY